MRRVIALAAATAATIGIAMTFAWIYCSSASQMSGGAATVADYVICTIVLILVGMPFVSAVYDISTTEEVRK